MKLQEIMTKNVEVINPGVSIRDAAMKMKDLNVGSIPVVEGERAVGIVTDRDITIRATAQGSDPNTTSVRDVMTREFIFCYVDEDIKEAAGKMRDHQIRRIPILDRGGKLVGIVSLGDVSVEGDDDQLSGRTLEDISKPSKPDR